MSYLYIANFTYFFVVLETVSPLDFQNIGTEHVEQTSDPTSFGNKPIRALGLSSLRYFFT